MSEKEIISDGNFLIAGFDDNLKPYGDSEFIYKNHHVCNTNTFRYHSSWDWQISVWAKIVGLCQNLVSKKTDMAEFESAKKEYYKFLDKHEQAVCTNNVLVGFKIISEIIKWYNSQTPHP